MSKPFLEFLIENLMAEIYKVTGRSQQQITIKTDKIFIDYLALNAGNWPCLMAGWDRTHDGKETQWAMIGTEFGCAKFITGGDNEIPAKGIQEVEKKAQENGEGKQASEPPEIEDWYEQIGAMKT